MAQMGTSNGGKDKYPRREDRLLEVPSAKNAQGLFSPDACIFAGNLSTKISIDKLAEDLKSTFEKFGACHVKIKQDKKKGLPGAFVQFESAEDAKSALESGPTSLHGRCLRIERARGRILGTACLGLRSYGNITIQEVQFALKERGPVEVYCIQPYLTTFNTLTSICKVTFAYVDDCRDAIKFFQKDTKFFMSLLDMDGSPLTATWPTRGNYGFRKPFGHRANYSTNANINGNLTKQKISQQQLMNLDQQRLAYLNQQLSVPHYEAYAPGPVNLMAAHAQDLYLKQQVAYSHGAAPFYGGPLPPILSNWLPQGSIFHTFDPRYPPGCPPGFPPGLVEPMHSNGSPYMGHDYYSPPPPPPYIDNFYQGYHQDPARFTPPDSCHSRSGVPQQLSDAMPAANTMAMTPSSTISGKSYHSASDSSSDGALPSTSEQVETKAFHKLMMKLLDLKVPEKAPKLVPMVVESDTAPGPVSIMGKRTPKYVLASGKTVEEYVRDLIGDFELEGEETVLSLTDELEEEYLHLMKRTATSVSI
ncbi:hypothetical protein N7495_009484 [Penicillium taxi]|uniref:uncharacterized protein n=1 Tax=Penicillium taxi TaxID=168475 RepID=UPI00254571A0|nr:uncharacterized protein N7495_009484 [Penicillium taxi]KAJ5884974.1 hypothetical protein N7495_009484 [Penicillium taxi]